MPADILPLLLESLIHTGADSLIACTPENVSYLIDASLPFPNQYPDRTALAYLHKSGLRLAILPFDWAEAVGDQGFDGQILTYAENEGPGPLSAIKTLADALNTRGLSDGSTFIDLENAPANYAALFSQSLPHRSLLPGSNWLAERRLIKTSSELDRIEQAAIIADRGFIGAINHLEGTLGIVQYTLAEVGERIRVHDIEFDATAIGHLAVLQGADGAVEYKPATGIIRPDGFVRLECSMAYQGYWTRAARMLSIGQPTPDQAEAYAKNRIVKQAALAALQLGGKAGDVYNAAVETAYRERIDFCADAGVGHGVGRSETEAPYLVEGSTAVLQPGMAVVLDVVTRAPSGELIRSMDTYALESTGPRLLSWFKRWDKLYAITGFRATH